MTTICDLRTQRIRLLVESSGWLVTKYIMKADEGNFLSKYKERHAVKKTRLLLDDPHLFPRFQPAVKLIESAFFLHEFQTRTPLVSIHEKSLGLPFKGRTMKTYFAPLAELGRSLREELGEEECSAFLEYVLFMGRDVAAASVEKCGERISGAEMMALDELAKAFELPRLRDEEYEYTPSARR
mmetsp:Transcript_6019/g.14660  ORF Transcript_6019/g.14660 Transcript_6019/m.14660 type:complete len:183 (-) Transcript_6019:539-1087(-)